LLLGSFGSSQGYNDRLFTINIATDPRTPPPATEKPLRYGKLAEIHHIFKSDPTSPSIVFSLLFTTAVLATLPALFGLVSSCILCIMPALIILSQWLYLGGNVNHFSKAFQSAPVSHTLFYSSIIGIEVIFFLYYTSWNLFKTLPVLFAVGMITFLSGSRALSEVQRRRLAGLR
jgi:oligosaccharyltransferase complex subunit delta (ribophorin II)